MAVRFCLGPKILAAKLRAGPFRFVFFVVYDLALFAKKVLFLFVTVCSKFSTLDKELFEV